MTRGSSGRATARSRPPATTRSYPTSYSAQHPDLEWLIGPDGVLDPTRWFIVIPNMFGNGLSSSPSNTPDYPALVTPCDNVQAQRRLVAEVFGIAQLAGVYG